MVGGATAALKSRLHAELRDVCEQDPLPVGPGRLLQEFHQLWGPQILEKHSQLWRKGEHSPLMPYPEPQQLGDDSMRKASDAYFS